MNLARHDLALPSWENILEQMINRSIVFTEKLGVPVAWALHAGSFLALLELIFCVPSPGLD